MATDLLPFGDVSARVGLTVATLRYYESRGLPPAPWATSAATRARCGAGSPSSPSPATSI